MIYSKTPFLKKSCILFVEKKMDRRKPAEPIYKEIGNNISNLRKDLKITQQELANKINTTRQTITLYETGLRRIPVVSLIDIAKILHVDLMELFPVQKARKSNPESKVRRSLEKINDLNKSDQKIILDLLDSLYKKSQKK